MTDLIRNALLAGWSIRPTKKGYMLLPPNREIGPDGRNRCPGVLIHKTPSDRRTQDNVAAMIKRFGKPPAGPEPGRRQGTQNLGRLSPESDPTGSRSAGSPSAKPTAAKPRYPDAA